MIFEVERSDPSQDPDAVKLPAYHRAISQTEHLRRLRALQKLNLEFHYRTSNIWIFWFSTACKKYVKNE